MSTFARNPTGTTSSALSSSAARVAANGGDIGDDDDTKAKESCTQKYLTNCKSLYSCIHCRTHLANHDELVSRSFQGNHGRAYLFNSVINISCGPPVQRQLNTGSHAVADIFCSNCEKTLGWKYEKAYVETQKYKEGKYIIEMAHVVRENRHLELDRGDIFLGRQLSKSKPHARQHNIISSLTYSSSSQLSSPTDSAFGGDSLDVDNDYGGCGGGGDDDDDEELMFPFYDDLCASRSSYPGNLSMSHRDRNRRSLYLESKPYDWKNSPASSSPRLTSTSATTSADSAIASDDPPSLISCTSSSASRSGCRHASSNKGHDGQDVVCSSRQTETSKANKRPKHDHCGNKNDFNQDNSNDDDGETQFELEHDLPQRAIVGRAQASSSSDRDGTRSTSDGVEVFPVAGGSGIGKVKLDNNQSRRHTINLDDEEFFDCNSEHDVLNSLLWPRA